MTYLPRSDYLALRHREELAERKKKDEAAFDQVLTQCVIAYVNYRQGGGQGDFEPFKRQWYSEQGQQT